MRMLFGKRVCILHRYCLSNLSHDRQIDNVVTHIGSLFKGKPKLGKQFFESG